MPLTPLQISTDLAEVGAVLNLLTEEGSARVVVVEPIGAGEIAFAAVASDWANPPPTTLEEAADLLASRAPVQFLAPALGPLATLTFTTPPIVPQKSGRFLVIASIAAAASVASQQTGNLLADAANLGSSLSGTSAPGGAAAQTIVAVVSLPNTAPHTFTANITTSAGTLTAAAGRVRIVAIEF
jgi:hypothetical protein